MNRAAGSWRLPSTPRSQPDIQMSGSLGMPFGPVKVRDTQSFLWVLIILGSGGMTVAGRPQQSRQSAGGTKIQNPDNRVARGRYIAEGVAMCGMCHTPRTDSGEVESSRALDGASVWLLPAHPTGNWPLKAPRIAGTPPASDEDMVRLLTTGIWTDGTHLRPPMPQFRMSREDAESVVAYLRSLRPGPGD
jgi:mono/diheme cytochrome c family protein